MPELKAGFRVALVKEEGGFYVPDPETGEMRKGTPEERAACDRILAAERAFERSWLGRVIGFFERIPKAWNVLWGIDNGR